MNPAARSRHTRTTVALLIVGGGLMIAFDHTATLIAGFVCLVAFVVSGIALICQPAFLESDADAGPG